MRTVGNRCGQCLFLLMVIGSPVAHAGMIDFSLFGGDTGNIVITETLGQISSINGVLDGSMISGLIAATVCTSSPQPPGYTCTGGFGGNDNLYTGTYPYFDTSGVSFTLASPDSYGYVNINLSDDANGGPPNFGTCQGNGSFASACNGVSGFSVNDVISEVALLPVEGGPSSAPVALLSGLQIGLVTGTLSGQGSEDYYSFYWTGGAFSATASIAGAPGGASYLFSEGVVGSCNSSSAILNSGDSFTGTLSQQNLAAGFYCIGIDANSPNDPSFSLTFNTPVSGVPEPATFALLSAGLAMIGVRRLIKKSPGPTSRALLSLDGGGAAYQFGGAKVGHAAIPR